MNTTTQLGERESISCPLCGEDQVERLFTARDRLVGMPGEFPVVRCRSCGFVYLNPRPTTDALSAYYPEVYYPVGGGQETPEALSVARGLLERVEQAEPGRKLRILDAGCGAGLFLKLARDAGHEVAGVELSLSAVEYGRNVYGLPIAWGTLESAELPADHFDVVTMWHMLEHTPDPVEALTAVRRVLKPGGIVLFGVPNIASLEAKLFGRRWFSLDAPRHLVHFSPQSARQAVETSGLSVDGIVHSSAAAGLVYSLMGDLTGVSLKLRAQPLSERTYHRVAGLMGWVVRPICALAARSSRGGAIEVYARKLAD